MSIIEKMIQDRQSLCVCALGTGAMGAGTALCFAMAGHDVFLYGRSQPSLDKGMDAARAALTSYEQHGLVTAAEMPAILARLNPTTSMEDAARQADVVVESVVEDLCVKRNLFAELDKICPEHTIFSTNTSGLSPTDIAQDLRGKDRFVVIHLWNPPHLIPLSEVVPGKETSPETVRATVDLMKQIGKVPVALQREALGFVGNRLQLALLREAFHLVENEVVTANWLDTIVKHSLGRELENYGPMEKARILGPDAIQDMFDRYGASLGSSPEVPRLLLETVEAGKLGAKTGKGVYGWSPKSLSAVKTRREKALFRQLKEDSGRDSMQGDVSSVRFCSHDRCSVQTRLWAALLREAGSIVDRGIVNAEDIDIVVRNSLGRRLSTTGPFESFDLGGLDVFQSISSYLLPDLCADPNPPTSLLRHAEGGHKLKAG